MDKIYKITRKMSYSLVWNTKLFFYDAYNSIYFCFCPYRTNYYSSSDESPSTFDFTHDAVQEMEKDSSSSKAPDENERKIIAERRLKRLSFQQQSSFGLDENVPNTGNIKTKDVDEKNSTCERNEIYPKKRLCKRRRFESSGQCSEMETYIRDLAN